MGWAHADWSGGVGVARLRIAGIGVRPKNSVGGGGRAFWVGGAAISPWSSSGLPRLEDMPWMALAALRLACLFCPLVKQKARRPPIRQNN